MKKSLYNEFVDWRDYHCGINLMTGKKVVMTAEEYEKYMTDADLLSPEMYNALVECGFLIENDVDEYAEQVGEDELKAAVLRDKVTDYLVDHCIQVEQTDTAE